MKGTVVEGNGQYQHTFCAIPYMGIHDVTTPYLGMLSLPLASLGMLALPLPGPCMNPMRSRDMNPMWSRDMVLKDFTNVSTPLRAARVKPRIKSG